MFYNHSPFIRRACLVLAAALGTAALSNGIAQTSQPAAARLAAQPGSGPALNPRHPERYVVQRGDTLWDISAMFLQDPWYWPEIWQINPQVENPHLIYPGDVLALTYVDGRPVLQLERAANVERLSPRIRSTALEEAIPTLPYEAVRAFLTRSTILDPDALETLPYVVAHREGLMSSAGRDVYVRRADTANVSDLFNVVNVGDPLIDPDNREILGYEALYVGQGRVQRSGDPATVRLTDSTRETLVGDYLVEDESPPRMDFLPRSPEAQIDGRIISVVDGVDMIGQYQVVALNRGAQHGVEPGHVLRVFQTGEVIRDRVGRRSGFGEKVRLPDEPAGIMMVFRTFDRVSYALIMEATSEIRVLDSVRNP